MVSDMNQVKLAAINIETEGCPCHIRLIFHILFPVLGKLPHCFRKAVKAL